MLQTLFKKITSANTSLTLVCLMFTMPFAVAYHYLPIPAFYQEWVAMLFGTLALGGLLNAQALPTLKVPQIALLPLGLIAILIMQWMLGMLHSYQYAILVMAYLIWAFGLALLGQYLYQTLGWVNIAKTLSKWIVAIALLNVIFVGLQLAYRSGLIQLFIVDFPGFGAIGQVNHFANFMAIAMVSSLYLYSKQVISLKWLLPLIIAFSTMLAFSGSRSVWLYLGLIVLLAITMQAVAIKQASGSRAMRSALRISLMVVPIFISIQWLVSYLPNDLVATPAERYANEFSQAGAVGGLAIRLHMWKESLALFMQSPWLGIGAGQIRWMSFMTLDAHWSINTPGSFEHAHNLFIHLLTEWGVGGAFIALVALVAWIRGIQWKTLNLETWWVLSAIGIIGIHSMLEYPLWYAYFLGFAAFMLGASDQHSKIMHLKPLSHQAIKLSYSFVLALGFSLLISSQVAYHKLETWLTAGLKGEITAQNVQKFYDDLAWANRYSLLAPYTHAMYVVGFQTNKKDLATKIMVNTSALKFLPMKSSAYRHVMYLELNGQHAEAVKFMQRAVQSFPKEFKAELQQIPMQYWDLYLKIFAEALNIKAKPQLGQLPQP